MWRKEDIPQEFKDATIILLFKKTKQKKKQGNPKVYDNHGDTFLWSITWKIFALVLLNWLYEHLEQSVPESQCGFRKDRGIIDMILAARQLQEKCQEQSVDLYRTFVNLTKAFDTISHEGLKHLGKL